MHAVLLSVALFGQVDLVPPSPFPATSTSTPAAPAASAASPASDSAEDMKAWLLARLVVDLSFDAQKSTEVEQLLNTMNENQLRLLVSVYKEKAARRERLTRSQSEANQEPSVGQAKLNLQHVEAYRDHLKREYDRAILQGFINQNLVYQNIINNQRMLYLSAPYVNGTFGYGPPGYAGFGYGYNGYGYAPAFYGNYYSPMSYGSSFGNPGLGSTVMYGGGFSGSGVGFW